MLNFLYKKIAGGMKDKHAAARSAFLDWVSVGKPRTGYVYQLMYRTRVKFKLALRHCKAAEEQFKQMLEPEH